MPLALLIQQGTKTGQEKKGQMTPFLDPSGSKFFYQKFLINNLGFTGSYHAGIIVLGKLASLK